LKTGNENGEPFTTEAPLVPSEEDTLEQRNIKEGQEEEEEETQQVGMSIHTYIQFLFIHFCLKLRL
jgi:hypothetical protein